MEKLLLRAHPVFETPTVAASKKISPANIVFEFGFNTPAMLGIWAFSSSPRPLTEP